MATTRDLQLRIVDDWHLDPMNQRNDKSVNPLALDAMDEVTNAGHADFLFKGSKHEEGGLFSPVKDYPIPTWARYFGANRMVAYMMPETLAQDEFDVKFTLPGNLGQINGSLQVNFANESGMWDWDPNQPAKWEPTGFNVMAALGSTAYNEHEFQSRFSTDFKTWSLDALFCNGVTFDTSKLRRVPLNTTTGWAAGFAHPQEQAQIIDKAGVPTYTIKRIIRTQIIMSDQPITLGWK